MPEIDLDSAYKKAQDKLAATKTFKNLKDDYKNLKQQAADNLETKKSDVIKQLNAAKDAKKRFQKQVKSQFEQLLDLAQSGINDGVNSLNKGTKSNSQTIKYIKKTMIQAIKKIEPEVVKILFEESLHAVGCSQEQSFVSTDVYIKVQSIDIYEILKLSPDESVGASIFEKNSPSAGVYPFSMNRDLYKRIQSPGLTFSSDYNIPSGYIGRSGQPLFDISYVTTNAFGETGDFYKVSLKNRQTNGVGGFTNKVGDFMVDYYSTIQVIDYTTIFARLIDGLTGMISISANIGFEKLEDTNKFSLLIQRILGLCFDSKSEIDVSGVAKVAELDGFDDSFFEFDQVDLRFIEQTINDIKNGVVEFEGCDNVKLPVDNTKLLTAVNQLNFIENEGDLDDAADNLSNVISDNPDWQLFFPNISDVKLTVDVNFIKELPIAFIKTLLSPKVLLPIVVLLKALQQLAGASINTICNAEINSAQDFFKCFKTFMKNLISKVGSLFVKELFEIIRRDILALITSIIVDLQKEKAAKKYAIILKLVALLLIVARFIADYRKCKSVIDEILALLELVTSGFNNDIPLPLLAASQLCGGYSPSKAMINTLEELQSVGIPTGAMPDGSPNLMMASMFAQTKGQDKEQAENGKIQIFAKPLVVSPAGFTLPASIYGKAM